VIIVGRIIELPDLEQLQELRDADPETLLDLLLGKEE
jgi:hypothetical protein